jgi:uncharacterized protein (TIGR01370 family)
MSSPSAQVSWLLGTGLAIVALVVVALWLRPRGRDFVVFYADPKDHWAELARYRHVVLEPDHAGLELPGTQRTAASTTWLAYLSLGEVNTGRAWWPEVQGRPWVVEANPDWPEARRVDVRAAEWRALLLERQIPALVARGFGGLFFDTVETPFYLEESDPVRFAGSAEALVTLVQEIRRRWPGLELWVNNSPRAVERLGGTVDALVVEGLTATWDFGARRSVATDSAWSCTLLEQLRGLQERFPGLEVRAIEYAWGEENSALARRARGVAEREGWPVQVAPIGLDRLRE